MNQKNREKWTAKTIYDRLLYLIEKQGWTLNRLAELSALPTSTLYNWRYKEVLPNVMPIAIICDTLNITLAEFFDEKDAEIDELYSLINSLSETDRRLLIELTKRIVVLNKD